VLKAPTGVPGLPGKPPEPCTLHWVLAGGLCLPRGVFLKAEACRRHLPPCCYAPPPPDEAWHQGTSPPDAPCGPSSHSKTTSVTGRIRRTVHPTGGAGWRALPHSSRRPRHAGDSLKTALGQGMQATPSATLQPSFLGLLGAWHPATSPHAVIRTAHPAGGAGWCALPLCG
jgi:hypothetical protein